VIYLALYCRAENDQAQQQTTVSNGEENSARVNCMRQNTVEMTVTIIQSTTTHDLTTIGWTKDDENDVYTKTWTKDEFGEEEKSVDSNNMLVLTKEVVVDCPKHDFEGTTLCIGKALKMQFKCKYQLGDQIISSDIEVSGQDENFVATGTGQLIYKMTSEETVEIGKPIKVSIVPENPDFVFASLKSCNIVFETLTVPLTTFQDDTLESICIFGTNVLSGSSQQNLEIEWNAFRRKASFDALESEKQKVECTISLTKDDPNQKTKNCGVSTTSTTTISTTTTTLKTTTTATLSSVLFLYKRNKQMTDLNGKALNCPAFTIANDVEVDHSCAVTYQGVYYVYGGWNRKRQIAKITDKALTNVGSLPFDFQNGGCSSTNDKILLCFHHFGDKRTCYKTTNPIAQFEATKKTIHEHRGIRIASSESEMPVCGNYDPHTNKCEVLDISKDQWKSIDSYPYASSFFNQAVVYVHSSYFFFGGWGHGGNDRSTIARLDGSSYQWSKVGQLNQGRNGHKAIHLNDIFLVAGGWGTKKTEKCKYKNDQMVCELQSPSLTNHAWYPELMAMTDDFCD